MNPAQQELFDLAILRVLDTNRTRHGLGVESIRHWMGMYAFPSPNPDTILDRLDYHVIKTQFVEEVLKVSNSANRAWRITEAGINHVDNHP